MKSELSSPASDTLPIKIYLPLVSAIFKEVRVLLLGTAFVGGGIVVSFIKTGDIAFAICAVAFFLIALLRVLHITSYRRAKIETNEQARWWENWYVVGASASLGVLGIWCFLSFATSPDPFVELISYTMTVGYTIGIFGRNFGSSKFVVMQCVCAWAPMTAGLVLFGNVYHYFLAFLLVPLFLAIKLIAERLRRTLLDAIVNEDRAETIAEQFQITLANLPHGICMLGKDGRIVVANRRLIEILGLPDNQSVESWSLRDLLKHTLRNDVIPSEGVQRISIAIERQRAGYAKEVSVETVDGRTLLITVQRLLDGGVVAVIQDVTKRRKAEQTISNMARFDSLTGLHNRDVLKSRLEAMFRLQSGAPPAALFFIDLDHFKQVNDTLGHSAGDKLLKQVARRIEATVRAGDMCARFGGDEFVILQAFAKGHSDAAALANRLIDAISVPYRIDDQEIIIGVSVGIALFPDNGNNVEEILKNADMALYDAKEAGRATFRFFNPQLLAKANKRRTLELELRQAIEQEEFQPYFQPLVDIRSGKVASNEALVRWFSPVRGVVSPLDFIPIAEETGKISEIGQLMLTRACAECLKWPTETSVAVNISPLQFRNASLEETIAKVLETSGLPASRLEIEITESALLDNSGDVLETLNRIKGLGVRIALDDFGTGFSSLSYLQKYPFNKVKVDRTFVRDLEEKPESLKLLRGITRLSADLGLRVTVEGIETARQLDIVTNVGHVDEIQGYLFSKPVPADEISEVMRRINPSPAIVA